VNDEGDDCRQKQQVNGKGKLLLTRLARRLLIRKLARLSCPLSALALPIRIIRHRPPLFAQAASLLRVLLGIWLLRVLARLRVVLHSVSPCLEATASDSQNVAMRTPGRKSRAVIEISKVFSAFAVPCPRSDRVMGLLDL